MVYEARHEAVSVSDGFGGASARVNQAGETVAIPWLTQMGLEGRIFYAGHGIEEAGHDSAAALDDTTPSFALSAPAVDWVVIPLWFRAYFDTEGGAAPVWLWAYVQATKGVNGAGTAVTAINGLGGTDPRAAQGTAQHSLSSVTAITAAQNVVLGERTQLLDNFQSAEAVATDDNIETPGGKSTFEFHWNCNDTVAPITLWKGSSVLFYAGTGTTDSKYNYSCAWVEIPAGVYVPKGRV